jgi:hypothetical protein
MDGPRPRQRHPEHRTSGPPLPAHAVPAMACSGRPAQQPQRRTSNDIQRRRAHSMPDPRHMEQRSKQRRTAARIVPDRSSPGPTPCPVQFGGTCHGRIEHRTVAGRYQPRQPTPTSNRSTTDPQSNPAMKQHPIRSDIRYTVTREFCGHPKQRFVLRWCGEFIESFTSYTAAVLRATGHRNQRNGQVVVTEVKP